MTIRPRLAGLAFGLVLPALVAADANADHRRHWFFDSYSQYESDAYTYYVPGPWPRRRQPVVVYEDPDFFDEDEYSRYQKLERRDQIKRRKARLRKAKQRKARQERRWREKRIRNDLTRDGGRNVLEPRLAVRVPLPRPRPPAADRTTTASLTRSDDALAVKTQPPVSKPPAPAPAPAKTATVSEPQPQPGRISCKRAESIVAGFGFTDIEARSCTGKSYDFAARRDGKPFSIKLSAVNGELTEVTRN